LAALAAIVRQGVRDDYAQDVALQFAGLSATHWFGTDQLGRDIFTRLLVGLSTTGELITICLAVTVAIGILVGMLAARSRWSASALEIVAGAIWSMPTFIVALVVFVGVKGEWIALKFALLGLFNWVPIYRVVRDVTKQVQTMPHVTFLRSLGAPEGRVYAFGVLANVLPATFPVVLLNVISLIEAEFLLSFLGLSYRDPAPTLGGMLRDGIAYLDLRMMLLSAGTVAIILLFVSSVYQFKRAV
jgi:peptide/nickel transport system permease protein